MTAYLIVLVVAVISIAVQQTTFHHFVMQAGGRPDGLFKTTLGDYYKLWSFTVPLWTTTVAICAIGIAWCVRFRNRGHGWTVVVLWLLYVTFMWLVTVASSGFVEILGKGDAFV